MPQSTHYRRVVIEIGMRPLPRHALRLAANLAEALGLEMLGIPSEEQAVIELARLAFLRELRLPGHEWHPLDAQRLDEETRSVIDQTKLLMAQEANACGLTCAFGAGRSLLTDSDVFVMIRPFGGTQVLAEAASPTRLKYEDANSAIVVVPAAGALPHGSIAIIAESDDDAAISIGLRIAAATGEDLVKFRPPTEMSAGALIRLLQKHLGSRRERLLILPASRRARDIAPELVDQRNSAVFVPSPATTPSERKASCGGGL